MPKSRLKIVALGSSFAAGPGIEPIIDKSAMRSGRNYAHLLASKLDADLTDLTVSGATLKNVLNEVQETRGKRFEPQLDGLPTETDIVTLTAGGNDLGYSFGMLCDSALAYSGPLQGLLRWRFPHPVTSLDGEALKERFVAVIDRIREIAPKAKVYLIQYLSVFGDVSKPGSGIPLSAQQIQQYRDLDAVLVEAYNAAAQARPGVELVAMSKESRGHEVGGTEPWMEGFTLSMIFRGVMPYHPNLAGHEAVASALLDRISR